MQRHVPSKIYSAKVYIKSYTSYIQFFFKVRNKEVKGGNIIRDHPVHSKCGPKFEGDHWGLENYKRYEVG